MSVRRGQDWGTAGPLAPDAPVVSSDAEVIDALFQGRSAAAGIPPLAEVGLTGGDLHRTLGSPRRTEAELRGGRGMRMPIDVVEVTFADGPHEHPTMVFCAHLVATPASARLGPGRLFKGHTVLAMNAAFRGSDNLAPRAHPGDGLIDTLEGWLAASDRARAHRRFATGTHVPHPDIDTRRVREATFRFDSGARISLDGREPVLASGFSIRCIPDAVTVVV